MGWDPRLPGGPRSEGVESCSSGPVGVGERRGAGFPLAARVEDEGGSSLLLVWQRGQLWMSAGKTGSCDAHSGTSQFDGRDQGAMKRVVTGWVTQTRNTASGGPVSWAQSLGSDSGMPPPTPDPSGVLPGLVSECRDGRAWGRLGEGLDRLGVVLGPPS